ncbi:hypothetical protein EIN_260440 [Entamoeba invadens IP1]|uniref:DUF1963 domain-containing protein n=2 Tax=Entamoeba invadens TaxID=33085 RepID=L7FQ52_ENTIV|nr:hypothetical protein EIN_260440 [Entamoeba invadens IP1]ELP92535.1 hypothetical protein EIN_260440 [Entamoeba invadens IP1]BAN41793.1 hypothetical protein, conserved [Entamoeba invadens]|eukprot:XP_004259306.1 hypothetical protein EIN_260440 [Entamoeba invadens IP1]
MTIGKEVLDKIVSELYSVYKKPYIDLELLDSDAPFYSSKIGGLPYYPIGMKYPTIPSGEYMYLLAQINFSEMPKLENFPTTGILQIFIYPDNCYGLYGDNGRYDPTKHKVIYHENVDLDEKHQQKLPDEVAKNYNENHEISYMRVPFNSVFAMKGKLKEGASFKWYKKDQIIDKMAMKYNVSKDELYDVMDDERFQPQLCSLGGYPNFAQDDPRSDETYDTLLLQLESIGVTDKKEIMWGDSGVGNFFISTENLKKRNFDDVLYNYDCC